MDILVRYGGTIPWVLNWADVERIGKPLCIYIWVSGLKFEISLIGRKILFSARVLQVYRAIFWYCPENESLSCSNCETAWLENSKIGWTVRKLRAREWLWLVFLKRSNVWWKSKIKIFLHKMSLCHTFKINEKKISPSSNILLLMQENEEPLSCHLSNFSKN